MQNYPNYFPMYQNNQPMQNPYMDRLSQLQQFQQVLQQPQMPNNQFPTLGKMVESMEIVKATDIPMDGNVYYFPKADGTEIYSKQWLSNGQTRILTFKPFIEDEINNSMPSIEQSIIDNFNVVLGGIQNDLQLINSKIDEMNKPKTTRAKKEE